MLINLIASLKDKTVADQQPECYIISKIFK